RDLRAADPVTLETARLEHAAGGELVLRVLEDAAERPPIRRLRGLAPGIELADLVLDLCRVARAEAELGCDDDLAVPEARMPVREPELGGRQVAGPVGRRDEGA